MAAVSMLLLLLFDVVYSIPLNFNCLDKESLDDLGQCFTTFDEVVKDLGEFGKSVSYLESHGRGGSVNFEDTLPELTKPLTLNILEAGIKQSESLRNSPAGYLTKYGYVKGVLAASEENCGGIVTRKEMLSSINTFGAFTDSDYETVWTKMSMPRCSMPDIYFDKEGNLDAESEIVIRKVVGETTKAEGEHGRRKKRYAFDRAVDISEKNLFRFKLHNRPEGQLLSHAEEAVQHAFSVWSEATDSTLMFVQADEENADTDIDLTFVPDAHDDFTFSGNDELAHAPLPGSDTHGNVHFRENRVWDDENEDKEHFGYVATHEIGHWMGMKHTTVPGSVMQTILDSENMHSDWKPQLSDDDILGIRLLYGEASTACPSGWTGFEGMCYTSHSASAGISWDEALATCQRLGTGGRLVTIRSGPLNQFLLKNVADGRTPTWIGRKSTDQGWSDGSPFDWYPALNKRKKMFPVSEKCLTLFFYNQQALWKFKDCSPGEAARTEHFVCERALDEFITTPAPTTAPPTEGPLKTDPLADVPCQNYIRGAIRRGNYLYLFGTDLYFKYYYRTSRPELQSGYPKRIRNHFQGVSPYFTAVVSSPYSKNLIYFIQAEEVYEWRLKDKKSDIENGQWRDKRGKPRPMSKLFKTRNSLRAATVFDPDSILLFANDGQIGRWSKKKSPHGKGTMMSQYEEVTKWDFFDINQKRVTAITGSHYKNYLFVVHEDEYFLMRKTDGKIPQRFVRNLSTDFDKLQICDVVAPLTDAYPDNIHPDDSIIEQEL